MTKQEKWNEIVSKINDLGEELNEIFEEGIFNDPDNIEFSLSQLARAVDDLSCQDLS